MDITAIRAGLATAVGNAMDIQTFPDVPDSITPPTFSAGEVEIDYNLTFKGGGAGLSAILCKGRLYASRADREAGQSILDGYLASSGALSIKAAIEVDRTLGGVCSTLIVERVQGYGVYNVGGVDYYGAQFEVRIWAL